MEQVEQLSHLKGDRFMATEPLISGLAQWGVTLAQWGATLVIAFGLWRQTRRNGHAQKERDEKVAREQATREAEWRAEVNGINNAINSPNSGLEALKEDMSKIQLNCASVTSGFSERIKNMEKRKRGSRL